MIDRLKMSCEVFRAGRAARAVGRQSGPHDMVTRSTENDLCRDLVTMSCEVQKCLKNVLKIHVVWGCRHDA